MPGRPTDLRVARYSDTQDYLYSLDSSSQCVNVFSLAWGMDENKWDLKQTYQLGLAYNMTGGAVGDSIEGMALYLRAPYW